MGTDEQKIELFSKSLGFDPRVISEVLNRNAITLPCIYIVSLGKVKDLRMSMNIAERFHDDGIVCKYGRSDDFKRRLSEHVSRYNKGIPNAYVRVLRYAHIDPINTSNAESELGQLMKIVNSKIQYKDETELVVISHEQQDFVFKQFTQLAKAYMGHTTELNARIQELENQNKQQLLEHTIELQRTQYESSMKDERMINKDLLLKYKELENENLRARLNVAK
jgi:hypothetical protein